MSKILNKKCIICGKNFKCMSNKKISCSKECRYINTNNNIIKKKNKCKRCLVKYTINNHQYYCQECRNIVYKEQYEKNLIRVRKYSLSRYYKMKNNPEWKKKRYNMTRMYIVKRYSQDKNFAISMRLRTLLSQALKRYTNGGKIKSSKKYGINYRDIIEHLKPFPEDIKLYHIDHIIPLCSFNLENPEEIKKAFAPENHQWLLAKDNIRKGGKLNWEK